MNDTISRVQASIKHRDKVLESIFVELTEAFAHLAEEQRLASITATISFGAYMSPTDRLINLCNTPCYRYKT